MNHQDIELYDLEKNISGWPRIRLKGKKGSSVTLVTGELIKDDSDIDQSMIGEPVSFTYTLRGENEIEEWAPKFMYHGFRYVQVSVLQVQRILLRRETKIRSRLGQHIRFGPCVVFDQLRFQLVIGFLPAGQFVLLQERRDSLQVIGVARQLSLNFRARRIDHARLGHLLHHALFQDLGQ